MSRDSYEILHEQIHAWLHRKNIASSVRRVSMLPAAIATDIGLVRKENQDRVAVLKFRPFSKSKDMIVIALADGMGGMEGGANAASLTVSTFFTEIIKHSGLPIRQCLEIAVLKANESVLNVYKGNGGATLSALAVDESDNITAINVGDSRIYSINAERIIQISEDDTLAVLAKKYNEYLGSESGAIDSRLGGELVQFIGLDGVLEIHFHDIRPSPGGVVALTSDGAHTIDSNNLRKLYSHSNNTGVFAKRVIDLASWFGGFDNASIAVVEIANILSALDVSSGDVINLWDPFGEMKVISVQSAPLNISNSVPVKNVGDSKDTDLECNNKITSKKDVSKRKTRAKKKITNIKGDEERKIIEANNNDKLENISQLDISFSEKNSTKGDKDD
ncbi:PP2C family protein-serine/threonine phosphatase [Enterobacter bugandensis]|uniref:PP2C family protein-serine/threonine phosphatase n=1 Tax=Enterobacter bugandensis TaxID=881260 RepID=UPI00069B63C3|nr:protein phosphatase 2C domain-containing protein [Enterobacter bugandensis]MCE2004502.1 protein phosphatase 2C domain-containing protein [Enterobacter bugandensis]